MGNFGIRISKDGYTVIPQEDYRRVSFDSLKNSLKIYTEAFATHSVVSLTIEPFLDDFLVTHNLGYNPLVLLYFKHPEIAKWFKAPGGGGLEFSSTWSLFGSYGYVDKDDSYAPSVNKFTYYLYDGTSRMTSSPASVDVKYFVMADPVEDAWDESVSSNTNQSLSNDFGIRAAAPGVNVFTAEKKNTIVDTSYPSLKPARCIHFASSGSEAHGFGYPPAFLGVMETGAGTGEYVSMENDSMDTTGESLLCVDSTHVYYSGTKNAYITLFANPLNE